jgi:IclR helix-turn-helix domain
VNSPTRLSAVPQPGTEVEAPSDDAAEVVASPDRRQDARVFIELFPTQIDQIFRVLAETGVPSVAALLSGLMSDRPLSRVELEERYSSQLKDGALSRSLLRGFLVLACFLPEGAERGISELSDELELNISTIHRYVSTLVVIGVLEQNKATKKYLLPQHVTGGGAHPPATGEGT